MSKFKSTALIALLAALSAQSIYAQGQSSGEDTQRRNQQQQQQSTSSQSSSGSPAQSSSGAAQSATPSASGSAQQQQSATQSSQPQSSQSQYGTSATSQNRPATATSSSQTQSPTSSSTSGNDAFKSDTSATGRITSQGAPPTGQTSTSASATSRPGDAQAGASAQVNQQHVTQFQNVFSNWRAGSNQEAQLTAAINALNATGPGMRISRESITRFTTDMNKIIPRVTLTPTAQQRLAVAFATALAPNIEVTAIEPTFTEVRQVLVESGLSPIQAQTIACDLHLMAAEVHPDILEVKVK